VPKVGFNEALNSYDLFAFVHVVQGFFEFVPVHGTVSNQLNATHGGLLA
jgi:hypothetical protein